MSQEEFERNSFGIFKKTIDTYPENYSRQHGCYELFNRETYRVLVVECMKTRNGAYNLATPEDRTYFFLLALQEDESLDVNFSVFDESILPNHKTEIIEKLLILFMDFQNIHHSRRKNFLKALF
ncbi:hypothetical protein LPTSP3_g31120 [Leptospira kobayashii]|uniref:Uncharacterized protein n=1 Tax=Leptospira kobayashii TaxID=1917830 RepID=A0ABM7UM80_9LEPT|nr:hypothetical protein [Leptospira kobayashii]BDA80182.1 hypothetical protein LPTSP3_g31120 [Leptospira kobayashii]